MGSEKGYNGWTNYETWMVSLWINNEQSSQDFWRERAEDYIDSDQDCEPDYYGFETELKESFSEAIPEGIEGLWLDCINSTLQEVNWYEIAEHIIDDVRSEQNAR